MGTVPRLKYTVLCVFLNLHPVGVSAGQTSDLLSLSVLFLRAPLADVAHLDRTGRLTITNTGLLDTGWQR